MISDFVSIFHGSVDPDAKYSLRLCKIPPVCPDLEFNTFSTIMSAQFVRRKGRFFSRFSPLLLRRTRDMYDHRSNECSKSR